MASKLGIGIVCVTFAVAGVGGLVVALHRPRLRPEQPTIVRKPVTPMPSRSEMRKEYGEIVAKNKRNPSPASQDKVGQAEMRLAYLDAGDRDFASSRARFLQAARIKGTGAKSPDFGGINDQAAYQAAACLVAEKRQPEAVKAFRAFLTDYPMSPLVFAVRKRLIAMNGGKANAADDALVQKDLAAQEKRARFESAVCGPKTLAYLVTNRLIQPDPKFAATAQDYEALSNLCGTTDRGTSIDGLRKGLRQIGIPSYGLELNRKDFDKLPLPAILLEGDHYFAVLERHAAKIVVFDTLMNSKRDVSLPPSDDADFRAVVVAFRLGDLAEAPLLASVPSSARATRLQTPPPAPLSHRPATPNPN